MIGIEHDGRRAPLRPRPKRLPTRRHRIRRKVVQQLLNIVPKQPLKLQARPRNAVKEILRPLSETSKHIFKRLLGIALLDCVINKSGSAQVRVRLLGGVVEGAFKLVARPLDSVLNEVRKVFQSADGDRLFRRVLGGRVRLGHVGDDDLEVGLGAERAGFEEGLAVVHAAAVNIAAWGELERESEYKNIRTGVDVVEGVRDAVKGIEKVVAKDIYRKERKREGGEKWEKGRKKHQK